MAAIQVVTLSPQEWPVYRQIRLEALQREPQAFASRYADVLQKPASYWQERLAEAQAGENGWLLFARAGEQVIGMVGAFRSAESGAVEIISVYVTQAHRRQGAGRALMAAILAEVGKQGEFRKAVLIVNAGQPAALALYRACGFAMVGEKTGVMGDGETHTGYVMEKELGGEELGA